MIGKKPGQETGIRRFFVLHSPTGSSFIKEYNKNRPPLKTLPLSMFVELSFSGNRTGEREPAFDRPPEDSSSSRHKGPHHSTTSSSTQHSTVATTPAVTKVKRRFAGRAVGSRPSVVRLSGTCREDRRTSQPGRRQAVVNRKRAGQQVAGPPTHTTRLICVSSQMQQRDAPSHLAIIAREEEASLTACRKLRVLLSLPLCSLCCLALSGAPLRLANNTRVRRLSFSLSTRDSSV